MINEIHPISNYIDSNDRLKFNIMKDVINKGSWKIYIYIKVM